ncbi:MAG TPA: amidohydrolase family protein [Burkholderiales bacterium]|nr:amidohydrolase family protein [Burkholderiales bacterium]
MADDFLLCARWIVPVEPAGALQNHALAVRSGRIDSLLPIAEARARHADLEPVELAHHIVLPGLVNAHAHAARALLRGLSPERRENAERALLSAAFVRDGTLLACAEMLAAGITCFADIYYFPEAALEAARACGLRAAHGILALEAATAYASDSADYLRKGLALRDRAREDALAAFSIAPWRAGSLSDATLRKAASLAAELDLPVHVSLGEGDVRRLDRLGLLGPGLIALQQDALSSEDAALLARHGAWLVPSGAATPGVNVALRAPVDRLDLFEAMRLSGLAPQAALRAATLGGASALGLEARVGSLEPGKAADLIALDAAAPGLLPHHDPVALAARAAGRENVSHVWVAGRRLVSEGVLQNPPFSRLDTRWDLWQNSMARAGS